MGGIKEKVLAARRAGIKTVILPRRNERDLDDVPPELREEMEIVFVDTVDEVLAHALRDGDVRNRSSGGTCRPQGNRSPGTGAAVASEDRRPLDKPAQSVVGAIRACQV